MPNFYYSNPAFGVGVSNLAQAIIGDPARDVQMGLLGDRRRTEQVQRRKLEAEALSKEIQNREQEAAFGGLPDTIAALTGAMPEAARPGASAGLDFALRAGAGSNSQQIANAINVLNAMGFGMGGEDDMRRSLVLQGRQPTDNFAGTTERADELIEGDATAELAKALQVAGVNNDAAMERTRLQEEGRDRREQVRETGRDRRAKERTAAERVPMRVGAKELEDIELLIGDRASELGGDGYEAVIDPAAQTQLVQLISQMFQQNRNLPMAVDQGWNEVMGVTPQVEHSGRWNPFRANRAVISPSAASGGEVRVGSVEEAMALPSGTVFVTPDGRRKVRP